MLFILAAIALSSCSNLGKQKVADSSEVIEQPGPYLNESCKQ